jgi:hypothetical protein
MTHDVDQSMGGVCKFLTIDTRTNRKGGKGGKTSLDRVTCNSTSTTLHTRNHYVTSLDLYVQSPVRSGHTWKHIICTNFVNVVVPSLRSQPKAFPKGLVPPGPDQRTRKQKAGSTGHINLQQSPLRMHRRRRQLQGQFTPLPQLRTSGTLGLE